MSSRDRIPVLIDLSYNELHNFLIVIRHHRHLYDGRFPSMAQVYMYEKMQENIQPAAWNYGSELVGSAFCAAMRSDGDLRAEASEIRRLYVILSSIPADVTFPP